ncbi:hypothetical protein D3273_24500 [Lichenibacterium minor]|uniref:Uncharacterized protein n=1 Tax=Lichenibacterium minor TaxID=2316528 RepID=A0A4V1RTZ3_9HYPH|nr:hypothetical protein [Lichenibacterium minor]RYC29354.1 hypothetical protein D3273_24500 [Lichenibacterium minor]
MAKAFICLHHNREKLQDYVCSLLQNWKVKVYASMDDVFDHLWESGDDVDLIISEPANSFQEELFNAAEHWPNLLFVAVFDEVDRPIKCPDNVVLLRSQDVQKEILSRIDHWGKRHSFLHLNHNSTN